jgi:hypothetical protein
MLGIFSIPLAKFSNGQHREFRLAAWGPRVKVFHHYSVYSTRKLWHQILLCCYCYFRCCCVPTRYFKRLFSIECSSIKQCPYSWYVYVANMMSTALDMDTVQRFGKHHLKAGIATNRSGSPFARQRFGKHRLKAGIATNRSGSPFARQQFGKHISEVTQSTVALPLLGSKSPNRDSRGNKY